MTALWVEGDGFPKTEDNKAKNELLATLTPEQKGVLAEMLQEEHIEGIYTTLAYILSLIHIFSASLPMSRWLRFWSGSANQHSASLCISVCSMRMMAA